MRRTATIILWSILLIGGGYALGIGALWIALLTVGAALLLQPSIFRTPGSHVGAARRPAEAALGNPLRAEIARSRRHNRSFALVRLPWRPFSSTRGVALPDSRSANLELVALRAQVRIVDHVWGEPDGVYILLPESDTEDLRLFLARLGETLKPEALVVSGAAIYPDDGPTEEAILERLRERDRAAFGMPHGLSTEWADELVDPQPPLAS